MKRVFICTPDKDLSQCVVGTRVVQLDRRRDILRDEAGVVAKFGVSPQSIPDYLAVVGDSGDGFPGGGWMAREGCGAFLRALPLLTALTFDALVQPAAGAISATIDRFPRLGGWASVPLAVQIVEHNDKPISEGSKLHKYWREAVVAVKGATAG